MSASKIPDPFTMFRELYAQNENQLGRMMEQALATEAFAASAGAYLDSILNARGVLQKSVEKYCETMGLPTQNDLARVSGQVVGLESKVDDMAFNLEDWMEAQEGKLAEVAAQMAKMNANTVELLTTVKELLNQK